MECLGSILSAGVQSRQLEYHPKCKRLNITNLSFSDDVLIFSRATTSSLNFIKGGLEELALQTDLQISLAKTSIIIAGISANDKQLMADEMGISLVEPPVKYLGLPLCAANVSIRDCLPIVEKLQGRIKNWKNIWLTQVGRVLLIITVLSAFLVYWGKTLMIPNFVLDRTLELCLQFLWSGPKMENKMHHAGKEKVLRSKKQGGLGIRDTRVWNKAAQCGLLFRLVSKEPNIWVQWVWEYLLRNKHFWTMKAQADCSRIWHSILECRKEASKLIVYSISNGRQTFFWHDLWCQSSPLWLNAEARNTFECRSDTKVAQFIADGKWSSAITDLHDSEVKRNILATTINSKLPEDRVVWKSSKTGKISLKSAYIDLSLPRVTVRWWRLVWGKLVVPKHSFICWQLFVGSLPTQDRLVARDVIHNSSCCFCNQQRENSKHLFFDCEFSNAVWSKVMQKINLPAAVQSSNAEWSNLLSLCRGKRGYADFLKCFICSTVAGIWKARNGKRFKGLNQSPNSVAEKIFNQARIYLQNNAREGQQSEDLRKLIDRLDIPVILRPVVQTPCKWEPPSEGAIKINTDGSLAGQVSGFGGVVRNQSGEVLLAFSGGSSSSNIFMVELEGILMAIKISDEQNFSEVCIESDSLQAVNAVNGVEAAPWYSSNIVQDIRNRMSYPNHFYCQTLFQGSELRGGSSS